MSAGRLVMSKNLRSTYSGTSGIDTAYDILYRQIYNEAILIVHEYEQARASVNLACFHWLMLPGARAN